MDLPIFQSPQSSGYLRSISDIDQAEPYLQEFDREGQKVILSIQPGKADIPQLIDLMLSRYGHHQSIIGVNGDLEWEKPESQPMQTMMRETFG
jgi:hypothetical protein